MVIYPALQLGWEAPQDGSRAPYPLIVFGHGYSTQPDAYMSTLQHLASWGHIVVAPEVPAVHHLRFANDLSMTVSHMEREHERPSGQFYQQVDLAHVGAFGHTVGAGCLLLAAAKDPRVKAMVLLSPLDTMPSSVQAAKEIRVPISLVVAKDEWLASPGQGLGPDLQGRRRAEAAARRHVGIERLLLRRRGREPHDAAAAGAPPRHLLLRALPPAADECVGGGLGRGRAQQLEGVVRRRPRRARRPPPPLARRLARRGAAGGSLPDPRGSAKLRKEFAPLRPLRRRLQNVTRLTRSRQLFSASVWYPATRGDGHAVGPLGGARRAPRLWPRLVHRTRGVRHHALQPRLARVRRRGAAHVERAAARPVRPRALLGDRLPLRSGAAQREPVVRRRRLRARRALRPRDRRRRRRARRRRRRARARPRAALAHRRVALARRGRQEVSRAAADADRARRRRRRAGEGGGAAVRRGARTESSCT